MIPRECTPIVKSFVVTQGFLKERSFYSNFIQKDHLRDDYSNLMWSINIIDYFSTKYTYDRLKSLISEYTLFIGSVNFRTLTFEYVEKFLLRSHFITKIFVIVEICVSTVTLS